MYMYCLYYHVLQLYACMCKNYAYFLGTDGILRKKIDHCSPSGTISPTIISYYAGKTTFELLKNSR